MNKSVKGTLTEANLLKSFAGESQAKNRYTFFSEVAKKEGYEQIAGIFYETALQEEMHAKRFFSRLEGGMLEITAAYPAGVILDTASNLVEAAEGEYDEWHHLYPEFARVAEEEGFKDISVMYRMIIEAERNHETRYRKLLSNLQDGILFERPKTEKWYCRKCGYVHEGPAASKVCPACLHPQGFFELLVENY